jgi:hypothetical protein
MSSVDAVLYVILMSFSPNKLTEPFKTLEKNQV